MNAALPLPAPAHLLTQWSWQPVAIVAVLLAGVWYVHAVLKLKAAGERWPVQYSLVYALGLVSGLWVSCGFLQVYASSVYWAWTTQMITLWLGVPALLMTGRPLHLAQALTPDGHLRRLLRSKPIKMMANPLIGPALVPLCSVVVFFGPLPGWAIANPAVGSALQIVLVLFGSVLLIPLLGIEEDLTSMAIAVALAVGSFELILDAIPGIVMRLKNDLLTSYFDHIDVHAWTPNPLHDQHTAGMILWIIAEVLDLPFLLLLFRRWIRADARDAARIDAVLEAERAARGALVSANGGAGGATGRGAAAGDQASAAVDPRQLPDSELGPADVPWWVADEAMQRRLHGPRQ